MTTRALLGLEGLNLDVTVAIGRAAEHLVEIKRIAARTGARVIEDATDMDLLMFEHDIAVGAAGSTSWERACLGLPAVAVVTGDDQKAVAHALDHAGAAQVIGPHENVTPDTIRRSVQRLLERGWHEMAFKTADLCDGDGARRAAQTIGNITETSEGHPAP